MCLIWTLQIAHGCCSARQEGTQHRGTEKTKQPQMNMDRTWERAGLCQPGGRPTSSRVRSPVPCDVHRGGTPRLASGKPACPGLFSLLPKSDMNARPSSGAGRNLRTPSLRSSVASGSMVCCTRITGWRRSGGASDDMTVSPRLSRQAFLSHPLYPVPGVKSQIRGLKTAPISCCPSVTALPKSNQCQLKSNLLQTRVIQH